MNITDPISVQAAAEIANLSPRRMRELAQAGAILAEKFGRDWMLSRASVKAFVPTPPGPVPKHSVQSSK